MYLSQWRISADSSQILRVMGDCYVLHQKIMEIFPKGLSDRKADLSLLYRVERRAPEEGHIIFIQSKIEPDRDFVSTGSFAKGGEVNEFQTKKYSTFISSLSTDRLYGFLIHANPCVKKGTSTREARLSGEKNNGKRIAIKKYNDLAFWLELKSFDHGFSLQELSIGEKVVKTGYKRKDGEKHRITCEGCAFSGILQITDKALFLRAVENGIGPGKAFGYGLLSLAPVG